MSAPDPAGLSRAREAYIREVMQRPDQDIATLVAAVVRAYLAGVKPPPSPPAVSHD